VYRRVFQLLGLTVVVLAMAAMAFGAESAPQEQIAIPEAAKSAKTVLPLNDEQPAPSWPTGDRQSLGRATSTSIAPGVAVGYTWYDKQHNGTMGRMVDWGVSDGSITGFSVHFAWTWMPEQSGQDRTYGYNAYTAQDDSIFSACAVQPPGEYGGYVGIDVTADGYAVVGGNNRPMFYFDPCGWFGFTGTNTVGIPDSVVAAGTGQDWHVDSLKSAIWPKFRYQDVPGQDHVLHVFCQVSEPGAGDGQAIIYFRKVGKYANGDWDYPPYVVDTVFDIAQDIACSNTDGKMALTWFANLPDPGDCDTCSSQTGWQYCQLDNDVYYQISYDYGATFEPRVNLTKNVDGEDGYRPYTDASALIDSDNNLHIGWGARVWPADANQGGSIGFRCRMFHWGENLGIGGFDGNGDAIITTAANLEWDQTTCNGGCWNLHGCKMSISECDGKLYFLWTQFNDVPNGIEDDCHERALSGTDVSGSANGELYLAVSGDGGMSWDLPRNLTNTRTPHCDSAAGPGGRCQSEVWPSMARFGTDHTVGSNVVVVDPSSGYAGDWFLDVQYIDDADPGAIVSDEGTWTLNDVRWFRLACVEPVPFSTFEPSWSEIGWPTWTEHGLPLDTQLVISNSGNTSTDFVFTVEEDAGPFTGWLTLSSELQGSVSCGSGVDNTVTGTVSINSGGMVNSPGTVVHLGGRLIAVGNQMTNPDTLPINVWVMDTMHFPVWDTISTGCLALTISNHGNFGNQGIGHVNMDFFDFGDCDDLEGDQDTIPGNSTVYLYDASPVICWTDANDTVRCNWSIYGDGFPSENGFIPTSSMTWVDSGAYEIHQSEFTTSDSGLLVRKAWIVPKPASDSCKFLVQRLEISSADGGAYSGLMIGEAVDWDIPADSAVRNLSGFDPGNRLIFQQGSEYNHDNDVECQENSDRYGGLTLLQIVEVVGSDTSASTDFYGAYTDDNSSWVYPDSGFVPAQLDSIMTANEGFVIESDSLNADIHSVMTYRYDYTVTAEKTLMVYSCLVSGRFGYENFMASVDECHRWYRDHLKPPTCCMGPIRGNVDYDPDDQINISDLVYLVDWMWGMGPPPPCWSEANVDGSGPVGGDEDGMADIDISDLVALVDYMFTGGPPPAPCP